MELDEVVGFAGGGFEVGLGVGGHEGDGEVLFDFLGVLADGQGQVVGEGSFAEFEGVDLADVAGEEELLFAEDLGQTIKSLSSTDSKTTQGKFIRVIFKLTNNSKNGETVKAPSLVDLKERNATVMSGADDFIDKTKYEDLSYAKLEPDFTKTFCAIYEVPKDAAGLKLEVSTFAQYQYSKETQLPVGHKNIVLSLRQKK